MTLSWRVSITPMLGKDGKEDHLPQLQSELPCNRCLSFYKKAKTHRVPCDSSILKQRLDYKICSGSKRFFVLFNSVLSRVLGLSLEEAMLTPECVHILLELELERKICSSTVSRLTWSIQDEAL